MRPIPQAALLRPTPAGRSVLPQQHRIPRQIKYSVNRAERHTLTEDGVSGSRTDRAGLAKALAFVRAGDCLVVWKLDRLGRSLPHLLTTVFGLEERGIAFRSLSLITCWPTCPPLDWSM